MNQRMRWRGDRGSVTAETAVAMPTFVVMLLLGMAGVNGVVTKLLCFDAAREAALAEARGDDGAGVARRVAPAGAAVVIQQDGDLIRVVVRARVRPFGTDPLGFDVKGTAVAAGEPALPGLTR